MAHPTSQMVSIGAVLVLTATSLAVAHRQDRTCATAYLSMAEMTSIMAKGNCPQIGPVEFCDQEEFCSDNNCTGNEYLTEIGGVETWVKDCTTTIELSKEHDTFEWYEPVGLVEESSLWVDSVQLNCFTKCPCLDYCLEWPEDSDQWYCETDYDEEECIDTGWSWTWVDWGWDDCPEE